ncbi:unnamed protein product [Clonostachys rosea]|uniref:Uncharacterized protein n=1 Tax=Bionectria ochroleuca TaxID=29856 RepID=A0ABY6UWE9_BIOOC|nr:unnamed protein product [Clonostachys rosea]
MSEPTFPKFGQLPEELQSAIWEAATRPVSGPAAFHQFIIHGQGFLPSTIRLSSIKGSPLKLGTGYTLLVPWANNDSAYALDSALWTTSTASRAAMLRRYKKNEWWADSHSEHPGQLPKKLAERGRYDDEGGAAHTASYTDPTNGELRYISFLGEDLIHLDPLGVDSVDWFHHYASDNLPLINYRGLTSRSTEAGFLPFNIALDYDPAMLHLMEGRPVHRCSGPLNMSQPSILDMVTLLHELAGRNLWFVDHRLARRNESIETPILSSQPPGIQKIVEDEIKKFYANDAIYVEVRREDMHLWEVEADEHSPFEFLDSLSSNIEDLSRVKILACQMAPGKPPKIKFPKNTGCDICDPPPPKRMRPRDPPLEESDGDSITSADLNLFD